MDEYQRAAEYLDNRFRNVPMKLPYSTEDIDDYIVRFQKKYSPEALLSIKKPDALVGILLSNSKSSMMHEIMRTDRSISGWLGHVGVQYPNNFPFQEKSGKIKVGRGMPKWSNETIEANKAVEYAYDFVRSFANACLYLRDHRLDTIDDYERFGAYLESKVGKHAHHGWMHKYLRLVFPESFSEFHTYRANWLKRLGITPRRSFYGTAGQFAEIRRRMELKNIYLISQVSYNDPAFDNIEKSRAEEIVSIFDEIPTTLRGSDKSDYSKHSVSKPMEYGNWIITGRSTLALDIFFEMAKQDAFLVPKEVVQCFMDNASDHECDLLLTFDDNEGYAFVQETDNGAKIVFDDEIVNKIGELATEWQKGVVVVFERLNERRYSLSFVEGKDRVITTVHPDDVLNSELAEDMINREINDSPTQIDAEYDYSPVPEEKTDAVCGRDSKSGGSYPRDPIKREHALIRADYKCEFNPAHMSFISKRTGKTYLETHHLIPLEYWDSFDKSLDVEANIVCLCSNCHNEIHYGKEAPSMICELYKKRRNELKLTQILVSEEILQKMYLGVYCSES